MPTDTRPSWHEPALLAGAVLVFAAITVLWNPVYPFPFEGPVWTAAQPVAAVTFLAAGALIKVPRPS